jgi:hypothetical protein
MQTFPETARILREESKDLQETAVADNTISKVKQK